MGAPVRTNVRRIKFAMASGCPYRANAPPPTHI
jgi:hypothetical protein